MTIVTPPRPPADATGSPDGPELLFPEARRRRRRRWIIELAVVALCASGAGAGFALSGSGSGGGAAHSGPPSHTDPPLAPTAPSISTANNGTSAASDLLRAAPLPSGTAKLGVAPTAFMANEPVPILPKANEFDAHGIFRVSAAPSAVVAYVRKHLSSGWTDKGPQFGSPGNATLLVRLPGHGSHFQEGSLSYEAVPTSGGADLRVDAMVVWNPSRPSDESVPSAGPVVVTGYANSSLSQASSGPTAVTASGSVATSLRQDFNALPLAAPAPCMETEIAYTLRFPGRTGSPDVKIVAATCPSPGQLGVTSGGAQMAPLLGDCQLLQAVAAVLPADKAAYTHRRAAQCSPSALVGPLW